MRWTDRLPSTALSFRRADVTAFWIIATTAVGLVSARIAVELKSSPAVWGPAGAVLFLSPALWWRQWFYAVITAWNRFARVMTSGLRRYTLAVSYYIVFTAVGAAGSSLDTSPNQPQISKWLPIHDENKRAALCGAAASCPTAEEHQTLRSWSRETRRPWAWCLFPITTLLLLLDGEQQDTAPPTSTYTLY
jgi:hypothetical protein